MELTIAETRNNFSALIADLEAGRETEIIVKNRSTPVVKIVPIKPTQDISTRFGLFKDQPLVLDDEMFDAADAEIAEMFGIAK